MDIYWVKIESWHVLQDAKTLCGLEVGETDEVRTELGAEKSCESCLRILWRRNDDPVEAPA